MCGPSSPGMLNRIFAVLDCDGSGAIDFRVSDGRRQSVCGSVVCARACVSVWPCRLVAFICCFNVQEFVIAMYIFRRGTKEQKLKRGSRNLACRCFCVILFLFAVLFNVFDTSGSGFISKKELLVSAEGILLGTCSLWRRSTPLCIPQLTLPVYVSHLCVQVVRKAFGL